MTFGAAYTLIFSYIPSKTQCMTHKGKHDNT